MAAEAARSGKARTERKSLLTLTGLLMAGVSATDQGCWCKVMLQQ